MCCIWTQFKGYRVMFQIQNGILVLLCCSIIIIVRLTWLAPKYAVISQTFQFLKHFAMDKLVPSIYKRVTLPQQHLVGSRLTSKSMEIIHLQQRTSLFTSAVAAMTGCPFQLNITEHIFKSLPAHVSHKDLSFQQNELLQFHRVKRHIKQAVVPPESERPPGRENWL